MAQCFRLLWFQYVFVSGVVGLAVLGVDCQHDGDDATCLLHMFLGNW